MTNWTPVVAAIISTNELGGDSKNFNHKGPNHSQIAASDQSVSQPKPLLNHQSDPYVLLGQRQKTDFLAGKWEFPGGKIEEGESPEAALLRELQEELNIQAKIGRLKQAVTWSYTKLNVIILFYEVHHWTGTPEARVHSNINWFPISTLGSLNFPDANMPIVNELLKGYV